MNRTQYFDAVNDIAVRDEAARLSRVNGHFDNLEASIQEVREMVKREPFDGDPRDGAEIGRDDRDDAIAERRARGCGGVDWSDDVDRETCLDEKYEIE